MFSKCFFTDVSRNAFSQEVHPASRRQIVSFGHWKLLRIDPFESVQDYTLYSHGILTILISLGHGATYCLEDKCNAHIKKKKLITISSYSFQWLKAIVECYLVYRKHMYSVFIACLNTYTHTYPHTQTFTWQAQRGAMILM